MESNMLIQKPIFEGEIQAKIKQLGEIESNIAEVKSFALKLARYYDEVIFDDDSIKQAKEEKAKINKFKDQVANYRKDILKQWKEPINQFEAIAKETESLLDSAYSNINMQCYSYEERKKQEKENVLRDFFNEYCKSYEIDFIEFGDLGLNITLSKSEKSLKEQIITYLDRIKAELDVIDTIDNKIEVLAEYKKSLSLTRSITIVCERKEREAEELKRQQEKAEQKNEQLQTAEKLIEKEEITAPTIVEEPKEEKQFEMTFTVKGTMEQLKALKEYLKQNNLIKEE